MLSRVNAFIFSLAICFFAGESLQAQSLGFSIDGGTTFATEFDANVGDTTTVEIFVNDDGSNSVAASGLTTFGFDVQHNTGLGSITAITADSAFEAIISPVDLRADGGSIEQGTNSATFPTGIFVPVATIDFDSTAEGDTNFNFTDPNPDAFTGFLTGGLVNLDPALFAVSPNFTISSSSVPEPSSGLLLVAACSSFLLRRKRRL